ncbi:MAG: hypothetical protein AAF329_22435 [Cyanobacteria bacterium P01_A01_bin.17]
MGQDVNQWVNQPLPNGAAQQQPTPQATQPQVQNPTQQHYQPPYQPSQGYQQPTQFYPQHYRPQPPINWEKWSCMVAASFGFLIIGILIGGNWLKTA